MTLSVQADLEYGVAHGDVDSEARSSGWKNAFEICFSDGCEQVRLELFGLLKPRDEVSQVGRYLHLGFAIKGAVEDCEKPEAVGDENVVEHLAQFFVFRSGGVVLDRVQQSGIGPSLVAE